MVIDIPAAAGVDLYFFSGTNLKDVVRRYNLFSGGGCLPPLKGMGILFRGYTGAKQEDILEMARAMREDRMPCDILGLEPGWHSHSYSCSYTWNRENYPKPADMLHTLKENHFDVNLWEQAFVHPTAPFHKEVRDLSGDYLVWEGLVPDFTLDGVREPFAAHHRKMILSGIDGFKLDECDSSDFTGGWSFPDCSKFPSGLDGERMHNQLGVQFQSLQYETFKGVDKRTYGQVRASHALAAPYPFVLYSDLYDHREFWNAFVNAGFSGLLWTPEVRQTDSAEELVRRVQTVCLSPQAAINAWMIPNLPWRQFDYDKNMAGEFLPEAEREELTGIIRKALELRMGLVPYLYTAFRRYLDDGEPVFRALVMDYPTDANTYEISDQILIGDALMAAPMVANEGNKRDIYLPEGVWYDLETGNQLAGGRWLREVEVPLDRIPIFVRENTILPLAVPVQWIEQDTRFDLTLRIYGDGEAHVVLYEDDGRSFAYEKGEAGFIDLTWSDGRMNVSEGYISPMNRYRIQTIEKVGC